MYKKKLRLVSTISALLSTAALMFLLTLAVTWFNFHRLNVANNDARAEMVLVDQLYGAHTELRRTRLSLERANAANILGANEMRDQAIRSAFMSYSRSEQYLQHFLAQDIQGIDKDALREAFDSYRHEVIDPTFQTIQNNDPKAHDIVIVNGASYDSLLAWRLHSSANIVKSRFESAQQAVDTQQRHSEWILGGSMGILLVLCLTIFYVLRCKVVARTSEHGVVIQLAGSQPPPAA